MLYSLVKRSSKARALNGHGLNCAATANRFKDGFWPLTNAVRNFASRPSFSPSCSARPKKPSQIHVGALQAAEDSIRSRSLCNRARLGSCRHSQLNRCRASAPAKTGDEKALTFSAACYSPEAGLSPEPCCLSRKARHPPPLSLRQSRRLEANLAKINAAWRSIVLGISAARYRLIGRRRAGRKRDHRAGDNRKRMFKVKVFTESPSARLTQLRLDARPNRLLRSFYISFLEDAHRSYLQTVGCLVDDARLGA